MVCYTIPTAAAIIHFFMKKKFEKNNKYYIWLNHLFIGGMVFGIVDHWWNKELFLIGKNLVSDLALGVTITIVILIIWGIMVVYDKLSLKNIYASKQ